MWTDGPSSRRSDDSQDHLEVHFDKKSWPLGGRDFMLDLLLVDRSKQYAPNLRIWSFQQHG